MKKIEDYKELIKKIPVDEHAVKIKKKNWEKIKYPEKDEIEKEIFSNSPEVELSRGQIKKEENIKKKIVMILMWGYPNPRFWNNIQNLLSQIAYLKEVFVEYNNYSFATNDQFIYFLRKKIRLNTDGKKIKGLGWSTLSKLLYFFDISIESQNCEIFDRKIVKIMNKKQFFKFQGRLWRQNDNNYLYYIKLINSISEEIEVRPDQIELFLFNINHNNKSCGINAEVQN